MQKERRKQENRPEYREYPAPSPVPGGTYPAPGLWLFSGEFIPWDTAVRNGTVRPAAEFVPQDAAVRHGTVPAGDGADGGDAGLAAVRGCPGIRLMVLPENIVFSLAHAFADDAPDTVYFGPRFRTFCAFGAYGARGLKHVRFPASLRTVGREAFAGSGLVTAVIPPRASVCSGAFSGCPDLVSVSVFCAERCADGAFGGCTHPAAVYSSGRIPASLRRGGAEDM